MKFFSPMALLLKHQGYPPAVVVAVLLHVGLVYFMLDKAMARNEFMDVDTPTYVNASVIQENPQRLRRLEELELQRAQQARAAQQEREQQAARERARQEEAQQQARREEAEREAAEAQRQREQEIARQEARERDEAERQAREDAARRERERQQQLAREEAAREAEAARLAASQRQAQQAALEDQQIAAYTAIIHDTVAQNWSVPPGARNGMMVVLQIRMVPTGEVVSVSVVQSSGDLAFDRSAEQAVNKAERFPELRDMPIALFEREFRTFNIRFRPEDLLR